MTRFCLSVSDDFFVFPSIFFEAYPHHYTPIRCCAQRLGPHYPPIYYSGGVNIENGETLCKCTKRFFYATGPQKLSSRSNESSIFMFFYFLAKKKAKQMPSDFAKIELSFEPELNFCNFWGLQNDPPKAL